MRRTAQKKIVELKLDANDHVFDGAEAGQFVHVVQDFGVPEDDQRRAAECVLYYFSLENVVEKILDAKSNLDDTHSDHKALTAWAECFDRAAAALREQINRTADTAPAIRQARDRRSAATAEKLTGAKTGE